MFQSGVGQGSGNPPAAVVRVDGYVGDQGRLAAPGGERDQAQVGDDLVVLLPHESGERTEHVYSGLAGPVQVAPAAGGMPHFLQVFAPIGVQCLIEARFHQVSDRDQVAAEI